MNDAAKLALGHNVLRALVEDLGVIPGAEEEHGQAVAELRQLESNVEAAATMIRLLNELGTVLRNQISPVLEASVQTPEVEKAMDVVRNSLRSIDDYISAATDPVTETFLGEEPTTRE